MTFCAVPRGLSYSARFCRACLMLVALGNVQVLNAEGYPGLPTRDQSPLFQGYLVPTVPPESATGWTSAHSLFITNTYQQDEAGHELLVIDVENTRYDLSLAYAVGQWTLGSSLSLIDNSHGSLDTLIEDWHDFFGLPQGGRDQAPSDRLLLLYQDNGQQVLRIDKPSSGLADLQLFASYKLSANERLAFILELPGPDATAPISNDATEFGAIYSAYGDLSAGLGHFGSVGLSSLANQGLFKDRLRSWLLSAQYGIDFLLAQDYRLLVQMDYHSPLVEHSALDALDHSLQMQFALRLHNLLPRHSLDVFFSEDIWPGHAPDITFALRLFTHLD